MVFAIMVGIAPLRVATVTILCASVLEDQDKTGQKWSGLALASEAFVKSR